MAVPYPYIDKQTLDLIKYPPLYPPEVAYGEDVLYPANNLRGKVWQFCYRYKYDIKMRSVFSPYSELPIPQGEELPNGDFVPNFHLNNFIAVKLNTGHFTVDEIEVAFRNGNKGNLYIYDKIEKFAPQKITGTIYKDSNVMDNIGAWGGISIEDVREGMAIVYDGGAQPYDLAGLFILDVDISNNKVYLSSNPVAVGLEVFPTYNLTTTTIDDEFVYSIFRNDRVVDAVSSQEANKSFEAVPLHAGSMEAIESNRLVFGDLISGFNNLDMDVRLGVIHDAIPSFLSKHTFTKSLSYDVSGVRKVFLRFPDTLNDRDFIYLNFRFINKVGGLPVTVAASYYYSAASGDTIESIVEYIIDSINKVNNLEDIDESGYVPNFKVQSYESEAAEYGLPDYDNNVSYLAGANVKQGGSVYIANRLTSHNSPSGISFNNPWTYFGPTAELDRAIVLRALPEGSSQTFYNYELVSYSVAVYRSTLIYNSFKQGTIPNIGIEYSDYAGRLTSVQWNDKMTIRIPHIDALNSTTYLHNAIKNYLTVEINNIPPVEAYSYRVVIDKGTPWFFQFFFYGFSHEDPDIEDDNLHYRIKINRAIHNLREVLPKSTLSPYIFEKGDRIRLIAYQRAVEVNSTQNQWGKFNVIMDSEIIGVDFPTGSDSYLKDDSDDEDFILDSNGNKIPETASQQIIIEKFQESDVQFDNSVYVVYEIYRPSKIAGDNTLRYETSKAFPIGNPGEEGRYHMGDTDQLLEDLGLELAHPARVIFNSGNVYMKMRYSGEAGVYFPVESLSLSDFYESDSISIGRTNVIAKDLGQTIEPNAYVWTGKLLEGSNINRLNEFFTGDERSPADKGYLQSKYGKITVLKEKGFVLHAIQDRKPTSMYIGREVLVSPDGTEDIQLLKDKVFGTIRPEESENGCQDFSSVCKSDHYIYYWDGIHSKFCRKAYNGVVSVSDYKQANRFEEINRIFRYSAGKFVVCGYDSKYDEVLVTFRYLDRVDYNLSVTGEYLSGDNKITRIGKAGGNLISELSAGMILTSIVLPGGYDEVVKPIIIEKVDVANKTIYIDRSFTFDTEALTNPVEFSATIIQRYEMITLAFHEAANSWKTRLSYTPELYLSIGDKLLMFKNGHTWLSDSLMVDGEYVYNNFFGIQYEQWIQPTFTIPGIVIILDGMGIISDKRWGMIAKGDITVKAYDNRMMDMESKLPAVKLRNVEGVFVSELLRDMNTPGFPNENYALTTGRVLRGQACLLKLTNFETGKVVLYQIIMYFTPS